MGERESGGEGGGQVRGGSIGREKERERNRRPYGVKIKVYD